MEYIVISLEDIYFVSEDYENIFMDSYVYDFIPYWLQVENFLKRVEEEINTKSILWENEALSIINELLILILRVTKLNNIHTEENMPTKHSNKIVWLAKQYMEQYYAENITLDMLAEKFFFNKFYLERCFKQVLDCTPLQYLKQVRMERAKNLLISTDFSISEIAIQVGYSSASHFACIFQKYTGQTPSDYIKNKR